MAMLQRGDAEARLRRRRRRPSATVASSRSRRSAAPAACEIGADFLRHLTPDARSADQRPELGEPPRAVHAGRLRRRAVPLLRRGDARPRLRRDDRRARTAAKPGTIVVLHACCHNPTGVDPTRAQWATHRRRRSRERRPDAVPRHGVPGLRRRASSRTPSSSARSPTPASSSSSRARIRSRSRCTASASARCPSSRPTRGEAARVQSQLKRVIRTNYSSPPTHGGATVASCSATPRCARCGTKSSTACANASARCASASSSDCGSGCRT